MRVLKICKIVLDKEFVLWFTEYSKYRIEKEERDENHIWEIQGMGNRGLGKGGRKGQGLLTLGAIQIY